MSALKRFGLLLVGIASLVLADSASAAPPWRKLLSWQRIEADENKDYILTEANGPWMIMAVTFSGESAQADARELVLELRKRYKLEAFHHGMEFDFSKPVIGRGLNRYGGAKKMRHSRDIESQEVAVLVGSFNSIDDPEAQETLHKLKLAQPECLKLEEGKRVSRPLAAMRLVFQQKLLSEDDEKRHYGPMGHAFLTTNPMLPDDYYVPKGVDKVVARMNELVEHSLLDCPGKYSVQVATFAGAVKQGNRFGQKFDPQTEELPNRLGEGEVKAHELAEALREQGYEAYEFHDYYASMVTIGSFDSIGTKLEDGRTELDPRVLEIMRRFGAEQKVANGQAQLGKPKASPVAGVNYDLQPVPVLVPRRAISADYDQTAGR